MNNAVDIQTVTEPLSTSHVAQVNDLLLQLSPHARPASTEHFSSIVFSDSVDFITAMIDGRIIGYLALILAPIPSGRHGYIEDVVVNSAMRGRGIAESLVRAALDVAAAKGARRVDLTSSAEREAANRLYRRIGFEQRTTNVYRYTIPAATRRENSSTGNPDRRAP